MPNNRLKRQKLSLFSLLLLVLFTYPFIAMAEKPVLVKGIPLLYLYLFTVWVLAIVVLFTIATRRNKDQHE